jgi:hypothetical protein
MIFSDEHTVEIDSFNCRVPAELVQINSPELAGEKYLLIHEDTGECIKEVHLNARLTDIDLKQDRIITPEEYQQEVEIAVHLARASKKKGQGYTLFRGQGIQFSERHAKQTTVTNPFCKMYYKADDFAGPSADFYNMWLKGTTKNVCRTEGTLKNKDHLHAYGLPANMVEFIKTPQEKRKEVLHQIVCRHIQLNPELMQYKEDTEELTKQQLQDLQTIKYLMKQQGCTAEAAMMMICYWRGDGAEAMRNKMKVWKRLLKQEEQQRWKEFNRKYAAA